MTRVVDGVPLRFVVTMRHLGRLDQGVSVRVEETPGGRELLRFDCYDRRPHYHYDPAGRNERLEIDPVVPDVRGQVMDALRQRIRSLLEHAGAHDLGAAIDDAAWRTQVDALETAWDDVERAGRACTIHEVAPRLWRSGAVTIGLTRRQGGTSVHVYVDGEHGLVEALCFDCWGDEPHYHYSPATRESVVPWDLAVIGDPLEWSLARLTPASLVPMLVRAGYAVADTDLNAAELGRIVDEIRERTSVHA